MEKIMEIPEGRGSNAKPSAIDNPLGSGGQTIKNPPWGVWIFSRTAHFGYDGKQRNELNY